MFDNTYEEMIHEYPQGSDGDGYLVNGSLYVRNGSAWKSVGNIKGDTGDTGFSPTVHVDHTTEEIIITTEDGSQ